MGKNWLRRHQSDGFDKKVWDLTTYKESTFPFTKGHAQLSFFVGWGTHCQSEGVNTAILGCRTGKQLSAWKWTSTVLGTMELAHNDSILATNQGKKIVIYHIQSGKLLRELDSTNFVRPLAFSPDDKMLVAGCTNGDILTWKGRKKVTKSTK